MAMCTMFSASNVAMNDPSYPLVPAWQSHEHAIPPIRGCAKDGPVKKLMALSPICMDGDGPVIGICPMHHCQWCFGGIAGVPSMQ